MNIKYLYTMFYMNIKKYKLHTGICLVLKSFSFNTLSVSASIEIILLFNRGMFDFVCCMLALTPPSASPSINKIFI